MTEFYYQKNWDAFDLYLNTLDSLSCGQRDTFYIAKSNYYKGLGLMKRNAPMEAFTFFTEAADLFQESEYLLESSGCYLNMAIVQTSSHDFAGSQETSIHALELLDGLDLPRARRIRYALHNNLGIICNEMGLYDRSIFWHEKNVQDVPSNPSYGFSIYNNLAVTSLNGGYYDDAMCFLELSKDFLSKDTTSLYQAYYLDNLGFLQLKQGAVSHEIVYKNLIKALDLRILHQSTEGQIKSYEHLGDYFSKIGNDKQAYLNYQKAYDLSADDDYQKLRLLKGMMLHHVNSDFVEEYTVFNDRLNLKRSQVQNTFALKRYQVQKQKRLSADLIGKLAVKDLELSKQKNKSLRLISVIIILFVVIIFLYLYQKRVNQIRKQRLQIERLEVSEQVREDLSVRLHDDLASEMLYGLQKGERLSGRSSDVNLEPVLDIFEGCYERIRLFSQELQPLDLSKHTFEHYLYYLIIERLESLGCETDLTGIYEIRWSEYFLDSTLKLLYRMFQEIFANVSKHSDATKVCVEFKSEQKGIRFNVSNNAVKLQRNKNTKKKGIGLSNIQKQVDLRLGECIVTQEEESFNIHIYLPYDKTEL